MKEKLGVLAGILLVLGVIGLTGINSVSSANPEPLERKIVVFKSGVLDEPAREALLAKFGAVKTKDLTLINGKAVLLPPKAEAALARQTGVLRIDDDVIVEALVKKPELLNPSRLKFCLGALTKLTLN